jgi:hypothetical protein
MLDVLAALRLTFPMKDEMVTHWYIAIWYSYSLNRCTFLYKTIWHGHLQIEISSQTIFMFRNVLSKLLKCQAFDESPLGTLPNRCDELVREKSENSGNFAVGVAILRWSYSIYLARCLKQHRKWVKKNFKGDFSRGNWFGAINIRFINILQDKYFM